MYDREVESRAKGGNSIMVTGGFGFGGDTDDGLGGGADGRGGTEAGFTPR